MLCTLLTILVLALVGYQAFYYFMICKPCKPHFEEKTVLITGASSGLGEEMTKRFVALGAQKVIIASRNVKEMERVKSECGVHSSKVEVIQMDLSKPEECLAQA